VIGPYGLDERHLHEYSIPPPATKKLIGIVFLRGKRREIILAIRPVIAHEVPTFIAEPTRLSYVWSGSK